MDQRGLTVEAQTRVKQTDCKPSGMAKELSRREYTASIRDQSGIRSFTVKAKSAVSDFRGRCAYELPKEPCDEEIIEP